MHFLALTNPSQIPPGPSIVRLGNCCLAFQKFFFLCFCFGKSSKTSGGRELALALPLFCPAVSPARATPLPGCGARSGERIALRTTEHLKASVSTRLLHAASVLAQTGAAPGKTCPRRGGVPIYLQWTVLHVKT